MLVELVNDILDFAKLEAGKLSIEQIIFDINDVLDKVSQVLAIKAQEKSIELIFNLEKELPSVYRGDPLRLGQVLINLMGNAIKFTDEGEVSLSIVVVEENILEFRIKDTGIGLTPEQIENLFENFVQATDATSREYGGTGLGLSISQELINLMGGMIRVESEYGKGSEFIFTIRAPFEKEKRQYRLPSKEVVGQKVLLIDKNESSLSALANMLSYFKYDSTKVEDISKAQELIENQSFDIIFIDRSMIEQLQLSSMIDNTACKVVILSNTLELNEKESMNGISIDGYLSKPFNLNTLSTLISKIYHQEITLSQQENRLTKSDLVRLKGSHIALVEDNAINQTIITAMLENTGIEVSIFHNGQEIFEYCQGEGRSFDLILMDVQMPIMDGYEATSAIEKKEHCCDGTPIIALTANKSEQAIDKALEAGMVEYLSKPIYMHELYAVLIKHIQPKTQKTPKAEDLILFTAKFNASIIELDELLANGKSDEIANLIIKMEKEAAKLGISSLHGMANSIQDVFKRHQKSLNSFIYEYEEASRVFFEACEAIENNFIETLMQEDQAYLLKILSWQEGVDSMDGNQVLYKELLLDFYEEYKDSAKSLKKNSYELHSLKRFAYDLHKAAQDIKAAIMIKLAQELMSLLTKEEDELQEFNEKYQYSFDVFNYLN